MSKTFHSSPALTVRRRRHTLAGVQLLTDFELLLAILASAGLRDAPESDAALEGRTEAKVAAV